MRKYSDIEINSKLNSRKTTRFTIEMKRKGFLKHKFMFRKKMLDIGKGNIKNIRIKKISIIDKCKLTSFVYFKNFHALAHHFIS